MDNLYGKVLEFLNKNFAGQIPDFEITDKSVKFLAKLSEVIEKNDELLAIKTRDLNAKAEEYLAEASSTRNWLSHFNISPENFSPETRTLLNELIHLDIELGTKPTEELYNTKLALFEFLNSSIELDAELQIGESQINHLMTFNEFTKRSIKHLDRIIPILETKNENYLEDTKEITSEAKNYGKIKEGNKGSSENLQFNLHTAHQELLKKLEEIGSLESELDSINKQLEKFNGIPPNEEGALEVIEKQKIELKQLDLLLKEKLDLEVEFNSK